MQETTPTRTAYRVETDRLVLRCWEPGDARAMRSSLDRNDQHLRPWIPFMKDEPRSLQQSAEWLRGIRAAFDLRQNFRYAVFDTCEKNLLGENMLLTRAGPGGIGNRVLDGQRRHRTRRRQRVELRDDPRGL